MISTSTLHQVHLAVGGGGFAGSKLAPLCTCNMELTQAPSGQLKHVPIPHHATGYSLSLTVSSLRSDGGAWKHCNLPHQPTEATPEVPAEMAGP